MTHRPYLITQLQQPCKAGQLGSSSFRNEMEAMVLKCMTRVRDEGSVRKPRLKHQTYIFPVLCLTCVSGKEIDVNDVLTPFIWRSQNVLCPDLLSPCSFIVGLWLSRGEKCRLLCAVCVSVWPPAPRREEVAGVSHCSHWGGSWATATKEQRSHWSHWGKVGCKKEAGYGLVGSM